MAFKPLNLIGNTNLYDYYILTEKKGKNNLYDKRVNERDCLKSYCHRQLSGYLISVYYCYHPLSHHGGKVDGSIHD